MSVAIIARVKKPDSASSEREAAPGTKGATARLIRGIGDRIRYTVEHASAFCGVGQGGKEALGERMSVVAKNVPCFSLLSDNVFIHHIDVFGYVCHHA